MRTTTPPPTPPPGDDDTLVLDIEPAALIFALRALLDHAHVSAADRERLAATRPIEAARLAAYRFLCAAADDISRTI